MLKYQKCPRRETKSNRPDSNIDLPSHSIYAEHKIVIDKSLGGGKFTDIQAGAIKNSDPNQRGILQQSEFKTNILT
jgi:hypothetical protein